MIRLTDATRLASTKLRTRKVRLVVTVVVAGLLFSVLAAASQVSRGAFNSLAEFNKEGFGSRYIIAANDIGSSDNSEPFSDPAVADRAEIIHKDLVARKTAEAKKLGIPYDPKAEQPPVDLLDSGNGKVRSINIQTAAGRQALSEAAAAKKKPGLANLKLLADKYGPIAYFSSKTRPQLLDAPSLQPLVGGKENYDEKQRRNASPDEPGLNSFVASWGLMSRNLLQPFMLPGTSATIGKDGTIPVVAPYRSVEALLGLKPLAASASPDERLERIKQVRAQADSLTFQICYRNSTSQALVTNAISMQQELDRNKNNKEYVKPALQYGLPPAPCTPAAVTKDTRTVAEKRLAEKQEQFDRSFGKLAPAQGILKFRVIGIAPDPPFSSASVATMLISGLVSSNLGFGAITWFTPLEVETEQPLLAAVFDAKQDGHDVQSSLATKFVEFNDPATAKRFIETESCDVYSSPSISTGMPDSGFNPLAECEKQGKVFGYIPFGSNALALESIRNAFNKLFGYAALAIAAIAAIIMIGTVGRIIADSRRETAVFRAIGAKKADIATTYVIYTIFLSFLIFAFALLLGFAIAQFIHARYAPEFTVQSLVAYNAKDLTKSFSLYSFYMPDMIKLFGLSLAGGLLSALFPLLRNLRRNPIQDMRDDT